MWCTLRGMEHDGSGLTPTQLWNRYQRYPFQLAKFVLIGAALLGLYALVQTIESVLFPVLVSLLLAYVADPLVDAFENRGYGRTTAIVLLLILLGLGAAVFVLFLYPTIAHLIASVVERLPKLIDLVRLDALPWLERTFGFAAPQSISDVIHDYGNTVRAQLPTLAKGVSGWVAGLWGQTGAVVASLLNLVLIPVLTFYFLRDFDRMKAHAQGFIPLPQRPFILDRLGKADAVIGAWLRGQIEVAFILGVLYAIGLGAVFGWMGAGVMTGVAVGMMAGLLNFIPYFGFLVGFLLSIGIVLIDWSGWPPLAAVLAVFAVVQGLEGWVITPRIVGEKVGMSPVTVILVLLIGGELLGLLGVVLAIPVAGAIGVLLPDLIDWYRSTEFFTGEAPLDTEPDDASDGTAAPLPENPAPTDATEE